MEKPPFKEMAKTLRALGMSVYDYEFNKAGYLLEKQYPNRGISDDFHKIAFEVFSELLRLESTKKV
jgi:hypothetical protein